MINYIEECMRAGHLPGLTINTELHHGSESRHHFHNLYPTDLCSYHKLSQKKEHRNKINAHFDNRAMSSSMTLGLDLYMQLVSK